MAGTADDVTLTFGGNATMLLRIGAFTLLTDPNFLHRGQRAHLGYGLRAKRLTEPALQPTQLPALDAILLSHMHGDHWDRIATRSLPKGTPVVTTPEAAKCLADRGFTRDVGPRSRGRPTSSPAGPTPCGSPSVPGVHGPGPLARVLPQVMGSVARARPRRDVAWRGYISGDTLYRPFLGEVLERCGPLDVLIPHLGGTKVTRHHGDDGRPAGRRPRRAAEAAGDRAGALRRLHALQEPARATSSPRSAAGSCPVSCAPCGRGDTISLPAPQKLSARSARPSPAASGSCRPGR